MKKIFTILILFLFIIQVIIAQTTKYSKLKIYLKSKSDISHLSELGVHVDDGVIKPNIFYMSEFSPDEVAIIKNNGFKYNIIIDDVTKFYVERNQNESKDYPNVVQLNNCYNFAKYKTPTNYANGSIGGYFTYDQINAQLDSMRKKFPNLISAKRKIDSSTTTSEGRFLYYTKISKNPDINENEPKVLYMALHHAREPVGMQQLIYYMYYLLENYSTNAEIKYLLDHSELYFVPCVNPDGYVYNQTTNPSGGGMWRKNRRNNGSNSYGVDLNRNYGFMWGYDNIGSSPTSTTETYRGPSAFSEPETMKIKWLCENINFKLSLSYHTYSNLLIYPYGYNNAATPDSLIYKVYGAILCEQYNLINGQGLQTVGYVSNGGSDDWLYGDQTSKNKIFAMTPELGSSSDGFWAPTYRIIQICQENLNQNLNAARLSLKYARVSDESASIISQNNGYLKFNIQRLGLDSPAAFTVAIQPLGNQFASVGSSKNYSAMSLLQIISDSIQFSLNTGIANGQSLQYVLSVDNGAYVYRDTITKIFGQPNIVFNDACSNMNNWTSTSGWGLATNTFHSTPTSITDSPSGNYADNVNSSITITNSIDLSNLAFAELSFWGRWNIEKGYDYVQIKISTDNGSSWIPICGKYTKLGNNQQLYQNPLYDGEQNVWLQEKINLSDYIGKSIKLCFTIISDTYTNEDGFYFDDVKITTIIPGSSYYDNILTSDNSIGLSNPIPNPMESSSYIIYNIPLNLKDCKFYIYNSIGQIVYSTSNISGNGTINLTNQEIKSGIYYYQIKSANNNSKIYKLVKTI